MKCPNQIGRRLPSASSEEVRRSWMKKRRSILGRRKRTGGARKAWDADCPRQRSRDVGTACREDPQRTARRAINNSGISHLGYPEHSCDEHWDAHVFVNYDFLQMNAQEWDCRVKLWLYFSFSQETSMVFSTVVVQVYILTKGGRIPFSPHLLQHLFL